MATPWIETTRVGWKMALGAALVFLFLVPALHATSGQAAPVSSPLKSITVVMDDNYPPYIFRDQDGKPQGLLVDEWRLWSQVTGVDVNLMATGWDKAQQIMVNGDADVIDTIFYNEQRAKLYDFTRPYAELEVPIYFHKSLGA